MFLFINESFQLRSAAHGHRSHLNINKDWLSNWPINNLTSKEHVNIALTMQPWGLGLHNLTDCRSQDQLWRSQSCFSSVQLLRSSLWFCFQRPSRTGLASCVIHPRLARQLKAVSYSNLVYCQSHVALLPVLQTVFTVVQACTTNAQRYTTWQSAKHCVYAVSSLCNDVLYKLSDSHPCRCTRLYTGLENIREMWRSIEYLCKCILSGS